MTAPPSSTWPVSRRYSARNRKRNNAFGQGYPVRLMSHGRLPGKAAMFFTALGPRPFACRGIAIADRLRNFIRKRTSSCKMSYICSAMVSRSSPERLPGDEKGMPWKSATVTAAVSSCPRRLSKPEGQKVLKSCHWRQLSPGRLQDRNESEDLPCLRFYTPTVYGLWSIL